MTLLFILLQTRDFSNRIVGKVLSRILPLLLHSNKLSSTLSSSSMSEGQIRNLDSQLPPTDSLSTLLRMHRNLAPNEPPPVSIADRILIARSSATYPVSDQGYTGVYSDDEDTYTLVHTHDVANRNHNQSNNYVPPRNNRFEFGLNGLTHLNHHHRHLNNSHINHIRNNHIHRGAHRSNQLRRRARNFVKKVFVLLMYVAPMFAGVLLGSILYVLLIRNPTSPHKDNFLLSIECAQSLHKCCITTHTIQRDLEVARTIEIFLSNQAGYHECGYKNYINAHLSRDQLSRRLNESKFKFYICLNELSEAFEHSLWLFAHNPHWGVSLLSGEDSEILIGADSSNISYYQEVDKLISHNPYKPIQCLVFLSLYSAVCYTWKYLAVLFLNLTFLYIFYYIHQKRMGDLEEMFAIIHKISNILRKEYIATKQYGGITKFHLITHLRDQIIPEKDRTSKYKLWRKAVDYISCNESRVRNEMRRIEGADVEVWKWIELEPMPTDSSEVKERMSCWQGRALDDYPPGVDSKVAPPNGTPSQCFRVENVFKNETKVLDCDISYYIEYCILDQCIPHGGVLDVHVDRRSNIGCVYVKMESIHAAAGAYRALHGAWYRRRMLIVKYMSSDQYNDLFQNLTTIKKLIYPPM
ncbi:Inner nuclear membrane protein Man1-like [Oopsacas minuta]|uniref:Inner nuclear membrane protein Man1-like n=1 Tax=Oopsacas minuta TaxID=111878 RepID=A0AAV7KH74_9METZ|nr:Inner nuclear membrane protein Man1-like [Oopsacas minuta]